MVAPPKENRLAILIDAENVSVSLIRPLLIRLQSPKVLTLRRAYGDWSKSQLHGWKSTLTEYGILPVHAPTYVSGKNSADMLLAIDAIDLLHQRVNWFCIVSNDSDFTPLVHRLTTSGAKVVGFGSQRVSQAFATACHKFIRLDPASNLQSSGRDAALGKIVSVETLSRLSRAQLLNCLQAVYQSFEEPAEVWIDLGLFGSELRKQYPDFNHKAFGHRSLSRLIAAEGSPLFEMRLSPDHTNPLHPLLQIRLKPAAA